MTKTAPELDTASAVLDAVRSDRAVADAESRILQAAVQWAAMHSTDSIDDAAADWFVDQPIPVAGPGAPLVAEFSIAELSSALGLPTEVGKAHVGEALELRHRLPRVWARVAAGDPAGVARPPDRQVDHRPVPGGRHRPIHARRGRGAAAGGGRRASPRHRHPPDGAVRHGHRPRHPRPHRRPGPGGRRRRRGRAAQGPRLLRVAGRAALGRAR